MTRRRPVTHTETHVHASLYHGARARRLVRALHRAVVVDAGAASFTTTETTRWKYLLMRRRFGPGWSLSKDGEFVTGLLLDTYTQTPRRSLVTYSDTYRDSGRDQWRELFGSRRRTEHIATDTPCLFIASHDPSGVQDGGRFKANESARTSIAGNGKMGRTIARDVARDPRLAVIVSKDTNVAFQIPFFRDTFERLLRLPSMFHDRLAAKGIGTHKGGRWIDVTFSNLPMRRPRRVGKQPPDNDHGWYAVDLIFTERP